MHNVPITLHASPIAIAPYGESSLWVSTATSDSAQRAGVSTFAPR